MSNGMGRELAYLSSHATNRYFIPNWGSTFSRHGIDRASSSMLIWLNENVPFHGTFSRHGITRASSVLLIWLNEKVVLKSFFSQPHSINSHKKPSCSP